jgi:hypothetical protein
MPTINEIAKNRGISPQSVEQKIRRKYESCTYGYDDQLPFSMEDLYSRAKKNGVKKQAPTNTYLELNKEVKRNSVLLAPAPVETDKEGSTAKDLFRGFRLTSFDAINYVDMLLVFIGMWRLFEVPGIAGALIICLFLMKSQGIAKNPDLRDANENAIAIVGLICFVTFFLHFVTFWQASSWIDFGLVPEGGTKAAIDTGKKLELYAHIAVSAMPSMFVSILNFQAINTTHKMAMDNKRAERLKDK